MVLGNGLFVRRLLKKSLVFVAFTTSEEEIEISYMFFPAIWGQGRATEAVSASLNHGFDHLRFEKIIAITQEANRRSCRLLEKVGMHHLHNICLWNATQRVYEITRVWWLGNLH